MNKINNAAISGKYAKYRGLIIGSIALMVLAAVLFLSCDYGQIKASTSAPEHFSDSYNYGDYTEGKNVYIDVVEAPYVIGYYDDNEYYYFAYDEYDDMYILRGDKDLEQQIIDAVERDGYFEASGSLLTLDDEVVDEAFNCYNEDRTDIVSREEFDDYFQGIGLWVGNKTKEPAVLGLAVLFLVLGLLIFALTIKSYKSYRKVLKYITPEFSAVINQELDEPSTVVIDKMKTWFTQNLLVSAGPTLEIVPYADVIWAYFKEDKLVLWDKNYQMHEACVCSKKMPSKIEIFNNIIMMLQGKNPMLQVGFDSNKLYEFVNRGKQMRK